jgi:ubiquitin-conjugating enzyme E2 variant
VWILCAWLIADLISGVVHWAEDRYFDGRSGIRFLDAIAEDNKIHHLDPQFMLNDTYFGNIKGSVWLAAPLAAGLYALAAPATLVLAVVFAAFGNLVHRFTHERTKAVPAPVRWLQAIGLFSQPKHHAEHHWANGALVYKNHASRNFCAMTTWLNPILDRIGLWQFLDRVVAWALPSEE